MKTNNVKNLINKVDVIIPDVTMDTVIKDGTSILKDVKGAAIGIAMTNICIGSAILKTFPLSVRVVKTTAKKGFITLEDFYSNRPAVVVYK